MFKQFLRLLCVWVLALAAVPVPAAAQAEQQPPSALPVADQPGTVTITPCKYEQEPPAALPPEGSAPVIWLIEACFPKQDNTPFVDFMTYQFYMKLDDRPSLPSKGVWVPFTDATERTAREDFKALWGTNFLDDLKITITDVRFSNGVVGKIVSYEMEERERVKIVTYEGSKQFDRTKLDEALRELDLAIAADSLLDERRISQVKGIVREMMLEKGFDAEITHNISPIEGQLKTVNLTFHITEGRKIKIREVDFLGNQAFSDGKLRKQIKENKPTNMLSWIMGGGVWNETKFEEDAERVREYYHNRGYATATIGRPALKVLENTKDGKTQWVSVEIPVTEGSKYTFGSLDFEGNKLFRTEFLQTMYEVQPGEVYSRKKLVEGQRKAQEFYGAYGFMEFTALPDLSRSDSPTNPEAALVALVPDALAELPVEGEAAKSPHVDVTVRITEGDQFVVNRIIFTGNTTTRDQVIRRELGGLVEGAPFDTRALKESVRRLNQLGYFQTLEPDKDVKVDKTGAAGKLVDVTMQLQEQNRNQLTFGAGVSQYEGFFGQLSFQTANFMGRGESLTLSLQAGARAQNFQLGFNKPFLFDTNMTGGFDVHKRALQYVGYYTQRTTGGSVVVGRPLTAWTRLFATYSYEQVRITDLNEALFDTTCIYSVDGCATVSSLTDLSQLTETQLEVLRRNPFVYDSLLIGQGGSRTISKVTPALISNTVNHPIFPTAGRKYTASVDLAVFGGNTQYYKPRVEGIWHLPHTSRTTLSLRGQFEFIQPKGPVETLPVFERLFLGGEYSVRGFDIRSIGPTVPNSLVVLGGNKSLLFNAEYSFRIAEPVRVLVFYDAGQVRDFGEPFVLEETFTRLVPPPQPPLVPTFGSILIDPNTPGVTTEVIGKASAFKTSTGVEVRFFMPVLNVPFRLIYAWNPQRAGVLDNNLQPTKSSVFKFSVGTTF